MTDRATNERETFPRSAQGPKFVWGRQRRSGFGIIGWTAAIIVIGGMLIAVLLPSLCKSRDGPNKVKCAANLHNIGLAISLYAKDNGGQYPPSLAVLLEQEKLTPAVLVCPSSNQEAASASDSAGVVAELAAEEKSKEPGHRKYESYIYVGKGLNAATVPATAIIAYESLDNHDDDGTNVLFGDGHTEWIARREWPKAAAAAGVKVISSLTTRP